MKTNKNHIVKSLENRIGYYRRCMVGTFILGLLAGVSILCGKSLFVITGWSNLQQISIKVFFCFLIATTGIATGSAYRRRIRLLKEHRARLMSDSLNQQSFTKPFQEQIITEIQALFGILFFLAAAITCIQYPIPNLPYLFDSNLVRLVLIIGFAVLCWISVTLERKNPLTCLNPLQDFVERQQNRDPVVGNQLGIQPSYITMSQDLQKRGASQAHAHRPVP